MPAGYILLSNLPVLRTKIKPSLTILQQRASIIVSMALDVIRLEKAKFDQRFPNGLIHHVKEFDEQVYKPGFKELCKRALNGDNTIDAELKKEIITCLGFYTGQDGVYANHLKIKFQALTDNDLKKFNTISDGKQNELFQNKVLKFS